MRRLQPIPMNRLQSLLLILELVLVAGCTGLAQDGEERPEGHVALNAEEISWGSCPPSLPAGCQIAVIAGAPSEAAPFVFRLRLPDGYEVPAHTHPTDANVMVISGTFNVGLGPELDRSQTRPITAGGYVLFPTGVEHFVWADGETVIQIHSDDQWGTTYVDPADDPRNQ